MVEDVALEKICSFGEPGVLGGDCTMPYPGNSGVLETLKVADTVKEIKLGKTRLWLGEAAVPGTSGLLETTVCNGIVGIVFVKRMAERPPVPVPAAAEDVKIADGLNDGCDKE